MDLRGGYGVYGVRFMDLSRGFEWRGRCGIRSLTLVELVVIDHHKNSTQYKMNT